MGAPPNRQENTRPIRVLFIVDSLYWVIGNFARQISQVNPGIHAITCSQFAIRKTVKHFGSFPTCFDVVHFLRTKTIPEFWGRLPIVTTFHHLDPSTDLIPFHRSDAVMTVSRQWNQHLVKIGIPETHQGLVPFGVNPHQFYPLQAAERENFRKGLSLRRDAFVLGFSSRRMSNINDSKGVNCFLHALRELHHHLPNLATLIIGPGWQTLANDIRRQGIPCTQAPYKITHEHIAKYYQAMDLFWVTSRVEGGPVPLLEAMASGLPCISTPVGAALDLIKDTKNGFIVPFDEPNQFVTRSLQLAREPELQHHIGDEARRTIMKERQWSQAQEKLQNLYTLAIKNFHTKSNQTLSPSGVKEKSEPTQDMTFWQNPMPEKTFYSPTVQSWIQTCEQLNGVRMMVGMREWKAASRFGFRALRTASFNLGIWKELISLLLKIKSKKSLDFQENSSDRATRLPSKQTL